MKNIPTKATFPLLAFLVVAGISCKKDAVSHSDSSSNLPTKRSYTIRFEEQYNHDNESLIITYDSLYRITRETAVNSNKDTLTSKFYDYRDDTLITYKTFRGVPDSAHMDTFLLNDGHLIHAALQYTADGFLSKVLNQGMAGVYQNGDLIQETKDDRILKYTYDLSRVDPYRLASRAFPLGISMLNLQQQAPLYGKANQHLLSIGNANGNSVYLVYTFDGFKRITTVTTYAYRIDPKYKDKTYSISYLD